LFIKKDHVQCYNHEHHHSAVGGFNWSTQHFIFKDEKMEC